MSGVIRDRNELLISGIVARLCRDGGAELGVPRAMLAGSIADSLSGLQRVPGEPPRDLDELIEGIICQAEAHFQ